jgi:hypothetical protein
VGHVVELLNQVVVHRLVSHFEVSLVNILENLGVGVCGSHFESLEEAVYLGGVAMHSTGRRILLQTHRGPVEVQHLSREGRIALFIVSER